MGIIKLLIADDHQMFRQGVRALLEKDESINVIGEAEDGREVLEVLQITMADVVLMDIDMGLYGGIETTAKLKENYPEVKVLALSMHGDSDYIIRMLDAGATGYILKNTGRDEMITAIKTVAGGDTYFSSHVSGKLLERLKNPHKDRDRRKDIPLTSREIEVLKLISEEYTNQEIADALFISIRTVDTHKRNLLEKLGLKNTAGLVKYAINNNLLDE